MPKRRAATKKKRITRPKAETREVLIRAGMDLFAKRGLDGPSLDDICAHADLTRGAFYVHFKDRDDFLLAVMDKVGVALLDELFAAGQGGFTGAVDRFVAASASGRYPLMPEGGIRPYQLLDACARSPLLRERYVGLVKLSATRIAELVKQGQDDGMLRADLEPDNAASFILALIVGLQTLADLGLPPRLDVLAPDLIKLMMRGS
jgi:TetR/AcrR family transcriptional regulator, transcriptional repressor for nem operon